MKNSIYILIIMLLVVSSCFDEYDGQIDDTWVSFQSSNARISEGAEGPLTMTLSLSAPVQSTDVVVPFSISSEDGLLAGTDYFQSASAFTIPAGQNVVTVHLLDSVGNNDIALGDRSLVITLEDAGEFAAGFPGPDSDNSSVTIVIGEDDFTVFGETSFEEVIAPDDDTRYARAGTVEMVNNPGDPAVDFVATGTEMGFDTSYAVDDLDEGESGSENLGVVSNTAITAGADTDFETLFERGEQGFVAADLDGRIEITFDEVAIPENLSTLVVEITFFANLNTTFEAEDALEVFYVTPEGRGDPIMSFRGDDDTRAVTNLSGNRTQGEWVTQLVTLPESMMTDGRLVVTMRNGADTEMFLLDYISIKGIQ
ncbi:MAG: hypothetical protein AAFO69_01420 [Bacteroidota bacterium]